MIEIETTMRETLEDAKANVMLALEHRQRIVESYEKALEQADYLVQQAVEVRDRAMVMVNNYNSTMDKA